MGRSGNAAAVGIDLGSVILKAVVVDREGHVLSLASRRQGGKLVPSLVALLQEIREHLRDQAVKVGVTGGAKGIFEGLDEVALENDLVSTARAAARLYPEARGIVEIGGHQSKWVSLGPEGVLESFSLNDQCAAGSGAFLEQQASRLQVDVERLAAMAYKAERAAPIAGRCAVFAKSDMIHQQQKGTPKEEIAYGLCVALARNFRATLLRGREPTLPALFVGGGALNPGLHRAFVEVFKLSPEDLLTVPEPLFMAAHGVALTALDRELSTTIERLLTHLEGAAAKRAAHGHGHDPLPRLTFETREEPVLHPEGTVEAYLGVDVGSVSTDLCLLSPDGEVLDGIYLATRGDPVAVLREGLAILRDRVGDKLEILGVGTTGSGRHLAGKLLGADVVKNEITCQVLGAHHALPDVDTILEIGGQDSKFIRVEDGRVKDFVMNKICAAGTGSFLEEQGAGLGVSIRGEFAEIASRAEAPADLGSQCTVFMDTEVVRARQRGVPLPDILAGLAYSVAKNYLERVVAGRNIGDHVVFSGGVASNGAVVAAFEALLGKPVTVHPHNRLSGAIGAAVAARAHMASRPVPSRFRGLDAMEDVQVKTFTCKACSNLCQVSRIKFGDEVSYFGDTCERFTARESQHKGEDLPDLFAEVDALLESYGGGEPRLGIAGVPRAVMMLDMFPFWATFLKEVGFSVVLSDPSTMATLEEGSRRLTAETCLPIKLTYGHVASLVRRDDVDLVFLPSIMELTDCKDEQCRLCPFEETVGFMVSTFAKDKMVVPTASMNAPREFLVQELADKLSRWHVPPERISGALDEAERAQREFEAKLVARGREVLDKDFGVAFVIIGKPYNTLDPFANLYLAQHLRKLGILPIPVQMLPFEPVDLESMGVTVPWRYSRRILRAAHATAKDPRLFPVIVSNFGCGPDAFAFKFLDRVTGDSPSLVLEFDEHRGEAGLITRLEAFIDEVEQATSHRESSVIVLSRPPQRPKGKYEGRRFVIPYFADHAWAFAGALRFGGWDAVVLPPPDEETLRYGEAISSGKECHPYTILAGDMLKHLDRGTIQPGDVFFFPGTEVPCLLNQYGDAMRLELERRGVDGVEILSPTGRQQFDLFGMAVMVQLGRGLLACDLLTKLQCQVRPYAKDPEFVDQQFQRIYERLAEDLAYDEIKTSLRFAGKVVDSIERVPGPRRPLVGVAGDVYTRINPFGNHGLFRKLENLGMEVWPAPFLTDDVEFGWRRAISTGWDQGRYVESAATAMLFLRKEMEYWKLRFLLGNRVDRAGEPSYQEVLDFSSPYLDKGANDVVILNVSKMVHFAHNGADGIVNAISFHCMLGTVSASLTESIRRDHGGIPITTMVYTGKEGAELDAKLEAFAHQVATFHAARKSKPRANTWIDSLLGG